MTKVRFDGPEDELQAGDVTLPVGVETDVSEETFEQVKNHPGVTVLNEKTPPTTPPPPVPGRGTQKEQ